MKRTPVLENNKSAKNNMLQKKPKMAMSPMIPEEKQVTEK